MLRLMQKAGCRRWREQRQAWEACVGAQHLQTDQPPARPAVTTVATKSSSPQAYHTATTVPYLNHPADAKLFHRCCSGITHATASKIMAGISSLFLL